MAVVGSTGRSGISVFQRYRYLPGNEFQLLVDGEQCGQTFLAAIAEARSQILFEMYLIESGRFASLLIEALRQAAERGVQVYVLLDHFGSNGLSAEDRVRLRYPGIELVWYNPIRLLNWLTNFHRDHRKLIIVDQTVAFVGGFCITDKFWPVVDSSDQVVKAPESWLDVAVKIEGPVIDQWRELFFQVWSRTAEQPLGLSSRRSPMVGSMSGRVAWANGHLHQGILRELLSRTRKANRRVWIATPYFVPSRRIRRTLLRAAKRGVDVRVLLPGPKTDHPGVRFASWRYYKQLLHYGVRIYEYQPRFIHAKVILADDWVSIGSCNLDHWNQRWNLEANQEVHDPRFARCVQEFFQSSFVESEEQNLRDWLQPLWYRRLLAYIWGRVDTWLRRL